MINGTTTTCTILMTDIKTTAGFTVSDLGTFIKVRVRASNTYGPSDYSSTNVDSALVQSAPTLDVSTVTLAKTMNSITATWTTSPSTQVGYGYATITKYRYRYKAAADSWPADWTTSTEVSALASHSYTIGSLTPDTVYNFQVIAVNQYGNGPESPTTYTITTSNVPDAPAAPTVALDSSGTAINISFVAPANHNNTITSYTVKFETSTGTYSSLAGICTSNMVSTLACNGVSITTLKSLTQMALGSEIKVKIVATNLDGSSSDSAASSSSVLYSSIPTSAVTGLAVSVVSSTQVSLTWTAQSTPGNGYSSITTYTVEYKLSSDSTWQSGNTTASSPATISGLTTLSTYYFRIKSTNAFGTGPTSSDSSVSATLYGIPNVPAQPTLTQTSGSTSIVVTWTAPANNGATIS